MGDVFGEKKIVDCSAHVNGVQKVIFEVNDVDQEVDGEEDEGRGEDEDQDPEEDVQSIKIRHFVGGGGGGVF